MRIAQVTPVYPPYRGGMGAVAFEYTERLRALGHTVEVFTPRRLRFGNAGWMPNLPFLRGFDVIHLHYPFFGGAEPLTLCPVRSRTPLVVTYHMDADAPGVKGMIFKTHRALLQPFILAKASKVLVSSLDYAEHSGLASFLKKYPDRVIEMPFGIDVPSVPSVPSVSFTVLFVGGLDSAHAFKGVPVLLQAIARVPEAHLVIVGDGDLRPSFETQAKALGLAERVTFLGSLSPERLRETFRNASVHVLPSVSRAEAFGLVTLEAAAAGIPSVVSDLPGVRTLVEHGKTGLRTSPGDVPALAQAIQRLLNNREERERMGLAARERVKQYEWGGLMEKLVHVYREVTT